MVSPSTPSGASREISQPGINRDTSSSIGAGLKGWLRSDDSFGHATTDGTFGPPPTPASKTCTLQTPLACELNGELIVEEAPVNEEELWKSFRQWCVKTFQDADNMMHKLSGVQRLPGPDDHLSIEKFCSNIEKNGWLDGNEEMLFERMIKEGVEAEMAEDEKGISLKNMQWVDEEKRRQAQKEKAREKAVAELKMRTSSQNAAKQVLAKFKHSLKKTYGSYVRAWRKALSPSDTMVLQKAQFFSACADLGWANEVRRLWKAFGKGGKDDAGCISIDELDPKSAETLAHFRVWVGEEFGSAAVAFQFLDRWSGNRRTLKQEEFLIAVAELGFKRPAKLLFHGLDKEGRKSILEEDLLFLDDWKPPAFLLASPNIAAVDQVKGLLLGKYRNYLKAWRRILDTDNSNRCTWSEFQACCKLLGFQGDTAGAWRALDRDFGGYITLAEIDPQSAETLSVFKDWATREFGSVRSAFTVFDANGGSTVTSTEFKKACRVYGYNGDGNMSAGSIFRALDVERDNQLSTEEVSFMDEWDMDQQPDASEDQSQEIPRSDRRKTSEKGTRAGEKAALVAPALSVELCTPNPRRRAWTRMPTPERVWWNSLPTKQGPPSARASKNNSGNSMWCAICKTRGFCSHLNGVAQKAFGGSSAQISRLPTPRASTANSASSDRQRPNTSPVRPSPRAALTGLRPNTSPASVSTGQPSWAWETERQIVGSPVHSPRGLHSPQASREDALVRHMSTMGCGGPDAEVQHAALRLFPIGTVTREQGKTALRLLASSALPSLDSPQISRAITTR